MDAPLALVIAVDGLRAAALGAYGNTWHPTPACDELAGRSIVFDAMYGEGPGVEDFYRGAWGGLGAKITTLLTDDEVVARRADEAGIADVRLIETSPPAAGAASVDETALAQFFAAAMAALESIAAAESAAPRCVWLHARGLHGPWDAPPEFRDELVEDEDPQPPATVEPPRKVLAADHDEIFGYRVAYAAQVRVLDECVGALLAGLEELGLAERTLVALVGCRGFPLGERGEIGTDSRQLCGELLQLPCFLHAPNLPPAPPRRAELAQSADLAAALLAWLGGAPAAEPDAAVDSILKNLPPRTTIRAVGDDGEALVRTAEWLLRRKPLASQKPRETAAPDGDAALALFVKPDDRWELNDVASRCPEILESLVPLLDSADAGTVAQEPV